MSYYLRTIGAARRFSATPELGTPETYGAAVTSAGFEHHWIPPASGSTINDVLGGINGTITSGVTGIDGLLTEASFSIGVKNSLTPGRINLTDLLVGATALTIGGHVQLDQLPDAGLKYTLYALGNAISVEVLNTGAVRYYRDNGTDPVVYVGNAGGQVPIAQTFRWDYICSAAGTQELRINGVVVPATLDGNFGTPTGSWPGLPTGASTFGLWNNNATNPMRGLIGNHQAAATVIDSASLVALAAFNQDVVWLSDADFGSIEPSTAGSFDPAPYMHPITGTTVAVDSQPGSPTNATITADGAQFDYSSTAATGDDSFTGHAIHAGGPSRVATLGFAVETAAAEDPRDAFWLGQGYSIAWQSTPDASDVGVDAMTYFSTKWNNGQGLQNTSGSSGFTIALAPDGSPSIKTVIAADDSSQKAVIGRHFGPAGPEVELVVSIEWWNPSVGGQQANGTAGSYVGLGHFWGARDNVFHYPAGSVNYDDSWSFRAPCNGIRNDFFIYGYVWSTTGSGDVWASQPASTFVPTTDRWQKLELQIIQNDVGSSNGIYRLYIDGVMAREATGVSSRIYADCRPRGYGIMIKHNGTPLAQETYYHRRCKMYTKPS